MRPPTRSGARSKSVDWRLWFGTFANRGNPENLHQPGLHVMALSYLYLSILGERCRLAQTAGAALILAGLYFSMTALDA